MIITTTELQNNFGKYLQLTQSEDIIISKNGKPVAKLLPYSAEDQKLGNWVGEGPVSYSTKGLRVSYEAFLKLTEESDSRYEFIDGEIIHLSSPLYPHQKAIREIFGVFYLWFQGKECEPLVSPFDVTLFRLGKEERVNIVQPDVLVICDRNNIDEHGKYLGVPALVVEVLSESSRSKDLIKKLDLYMESGVQEYWIVNPDSAAMVLYVFTDNNIDKMLTFKGDEVASSVTFPGLEVSLKQVFR